MDQKTVKYWRFLNSAGINPNTVWEQVEDEGGTYLRTPRGKDEWATFVPDVMHLDRPQHKANWATACNVEGNALILKKDTPVLENQTQLSANAQHLVETFGPVAGAKKFDSDKPMLDLLLDGCPHALLGVGSVLTYGFKKYGGKHGWKALPDAVKRYESAMLRHQVAKATGEIIDPESGLPHSLHIACNAMFLAELEWENTNATAN